MESVSQSVLHVISATFYYGDHKSICRCNLTCIQGLIHYGKRLTILSWIIGTFIDLFTWWSTQADHWSWWWIFTKCATFWLRNM